MVVMFGLRSSSCRLRIETGRWRRPKEKEEERLCLLCEKGEVENELHFVTSCSKYADLRRALYSNIFRASKGRVNLDKFQDKVSILKLVLGEGGGESEELSEICKASLNFVYLAMKRRASTVNERIV